MHTNNIATFALNTAIVINDPSNRNIARATVSTLIIGMNAINLLVPVLSTGLSIGFGLIDAVGGFNWFYNKFED